MTIKIKKFHVDAVIPKYMHKGDAGVDLVAVHGTTLAPGEICVVGTGLGFELPDGIEIQIRSRSGLASRYGIGVANSPGTVDSGYRGEVKVALINHGKRPYQVQAGDRIAQAVFAYYTRANLVEDEIAPSQRGVDGFGSTGV